MTAEELEYSARLQLAKFFNWDNEVSLQEFLAGEGRDVYKIADDNNSIIKDIENMKKQEESEEKHGRKQKELRRLVYDPILMLSNNEGSLTTGIYRLMFGSWPMHDFEVRYKLMKEDKKKSSITLEKGNFIMHESEDERILGTEKTCGFCKFGIFVINEGKDILRDSVVIGRNRYLVHKGSRVVYMVNAMHNTYNLEIAYGKDSDLESELAWLCETFHLEPSGEIVSRTYRYYFDSMGGFRYNYLDVPDVDSGIDFVKRNYNDDLPYEKIYSFLESDESGLVILHGEPGSGKTTFINHLMSRMEDVTFAYMSASLLLKSDEVEFVNHLINNSSNNLVFIIEDCESIIASRETTRNSVLPTILNLTDGLLGKSLKVKFILTFNCPLAKIDTAVLRKGRMKTKYEFKKLCLEKTQAILPEATKPMLLCDIYHQEDNGQQEECAIGFGR